MSHLSQESQASQIEKFGAYLQELDQSYSRLADLLRQKLTVITNFELARLDEIIKEEQVYVLLAKGFDANLQTHRENLGLQGDTLADVIEELPEEYRARLRLQHKTLKATLDEVKTINQKCQSLIEARLYSIDRSIKAYDKSENTTYHKDGDSKPGPQPGSGLFTKTI